MSDPAFEELLNLLKVLAHESRLKILGFLAHKECSVEELATLLELKEPTISHHLKRLKDAELVEMRPEGNTRIYWLHEEKLKSIGKEILSPQRISTFVAPGDFETWEKKVLENFFENEKLKEIPAGRKKRLVILKWLSRQFSPGVKYKEKQINSVITRYHPDCATLRREMIAEKIMKRKDSIYWLV